MLTPPKLKYCGITLELEFPSRHDKTELCSGGAAYVLKDAFSGTGITRYNTELRIRSNTSPYLSGTKVVLLCGELALAKLGYPPSKLNSLRGSPVYVNGIVYIPTYHPQQCADRANYEKAFNAEAAAGIEDETEELQDESSAKDISKTARRNYRFWFIQDIRKALAIAGNGFQPNRANYNTTLTGDGIITALRRTTSEVPLYLDIETDRYSGKMICFGWSNGTQDIYVAPLLKIGFRELVYTEVYTHQILKELALAISRARVVVCHNALFDLFILCWRYHIPPPPQDRIWDTMVAHARIHVDTEKSLGHCTSLYTNQPYHKDEGNFSPSNYTQWQQLLVYNAKDVETTALVHEAQVKVAGSDKGYADSIAQGNALVRPLLLKSLRGLLIDKSKLCARIDELNRRNLWFETKILPALARTNSINPRSWQQIQDLLYTKLGLPKSSDPTVSLTGKDALYRLALKFPLEILKVILHTRACSKEAGSLGSKLWRESHVTCSYVITGTKTFRLSSRKLLDTWGTNLQNWSKRTRAMVIARPGHTLLQVDQSGAEALIVAYLAPPGRYRDLFIHKINPHVYFGIYAFPEIWKAELGYDVQYLYELSIKECKEDSKWSEVARCIKASDGWPPHRRYYYYQKQINHSSNYGIKATRFAANLLEKSEGQVSLPVHECDRLLKIYHSLYPEIRGGFQAGVRSKLIRDRELRNLFGYPRRFYGWIEGDDTILKDAYSWIPQSTVGCITGKADSALQASVDRNEYDCAILQNNHDSLLVECREGDEKIIGKIISDAMNVSMTNPQGEKFAMRSEVSVGKNWYEMEVLTI
jgi:DNA polymerase I-like protein with 3'-5' exonuclease and polymerase domains